MIMIEQHGKATYLIKLGEPEKSWVIEAAKGMGMDRCTVLGAAFTKGLEHYFDMIREIEHRDMNKPKPEDEQPDITSDAKEHKEYNKGSCKG